MVGARFTKVAQRRPDLRFPFPERFAERLEGQEVTVLGPPGQVSAGRSLLRRGAGHASGHVRPLSRDARAAKPACRASSTTSTGASAPMTMWCSSSPTARPSPITTPAASASWIWCRARGSRPRKHFAGMGIEPLGNELSGETIARLFQRQAHAPEGRPPRPAPDRGARQHLCLRGPVPHRPAPGSPGGLSRNENGQADGEGAQARRHHPGRARRGRRGRRLDPARSCAGRRLARLFPALLPGLRPGGRGLRDARLHRHGDAPRAIRTLHLLLPGLPEALPRLKRKPLVRFSLARLSGLAYRCLIQR